MVELQWGSGSSHVVVEWLIILQEQARRLKGGVRPLGTVFSTFFTYVSFHVPCFFLRFFSLFEKVLCIRARQR